MTNEKEIIIHGVNVAECENLYTTNLPFGNDKKKCRLHQGIGKTCNDYPDCYFKKWQSTLKVYRLLSKDEIETKIENSQLKAENEKLKQYKASKQASYETMQIEWNEANNEVKQLKSENKALREDIKDIANLLDLDTGEEYNFGNIELEIKQLQAKEQECKRLKKFLNEIRYEELSSLDIDLDEYETSARQLDYSNIITLVERALGEIDV